MRMSAISKVVGLSAVLVMTGCATRPLPPVSGGDDFGRGPLSELKQTAEEVNQSLKLLAQVRDAKLQPAMTSGQHRQRYFQATTVPKGFEGNVTFMFDGDATAAAEAIASLAGYTLVKEGKAPRSPVPVSIHIEGRPLNEALRQLGVQTGDAVMVEIYQPSKLIRLIYKDLG